MKLTRARFEVAPDDTVIAQQNDLPEGPDLKD
jgi:hypothetical protein